MGSGASADNARATMSTLLLNKPADASDIKDLDEARTEIRKLRKIALDFQNQLREDFKGGKNKVKREAVCDYGNQRQEIGSGTYVPKVIDKPANIRQMLLDVVASNVLFSSYTYDEQSAIVNAFEMKTVSADSFVIRQGEAGDNFYVVEKGTLEVFVKNASGEEAKVGNQLGPGNSFGELALMYNTPRAASIKAVENCVLWTIDRASYRGIVVHHKFLRNKQYMEFLKEVVIMDMKLGTIMSDAELEKMVISLEREVYQPKDHIIYQGNTGDHFYIIAEGDVGVYKTDPATGEEKKLTTLHKGGYFGEKALLKEDVRQASCVAEGGPVVCLTLGRDDFIDMMGSIEDIVSNKPRQAPEVEVKPEDVNAPGKFALDITLADLEVRATLGCGAFGRVKLCRYPAKDAFYALKCQAKRAITDNGLQEHILNEMRVMRKIDHPFIAKLYSALQDNKFIYFVLELLQGGELFTYLRNRGKLSEKSAQFYAATVVYAFSTLHAKRIAYRDLKPENLVMDGKGYAKLVDFGLAKQLLSGKTWTLCGTPDYLAPEIILNEGHDLAVDYWALGVLIFEMVVGAPPFYAEDPMEVYEKILTGNPIMPSFFSRNLADLIKKLLRSQQGKRLGNTRGGTAAVVKHKWFSAFDWAALENGEMIAPYVPTLKGKDDVTNFDQFDEGEMPPVSDWSPDLSL